MAEGALETEVLDRSCTSPGGLGPRRMLGWAPSEMIGERVSAALRHTVAVTGGKVDLQASAGVALSAAGLNADALVALADAAMYESKRFGDGRPVLAGS